MTFDPSAPEFAEPVALEKEYRRIMDICHTCRRCYNLCPSFDTIFRALDRPEVDGEVEHVPKADLGEFTDLCYECKLCIPHCPYYPPHRWDVDIPRLVLRDRAARVRSEGRPPARDRILGSADALGSLASLAAPLVNFANRTGPVRWAMEKTLGVHRDRLLPVFHGETFEKWWTRRGGKTSIAEVQTGDAVAFFSTCSVNFNNPDVGKAAVAVLEKNGVEVVVPAQKCCGMPFLDSGDLDSALANRRENLTSLLPFVRRGIPVVTPGPTCSLTLKKEYPLLGRDPGADEISRATLDLGEYLMKRHAAGKLATDFVRSAGRIAYHVACHLKVQDIGFKSRDLLALVPGNHVETVEKCSGHDGTWSMKTEYFPLSMEIGKGLFERVRELESDAVATDCPLAGIQIRQGAGVSPRHPIQILADCYGLDVQ
ncbi:MAG: anaerobic glycerol-3-phosphate dehydrogenase subunit C [Thermoanaerobaculia bacterium]